MGDEIPAFTVVYTGFVYNEDKNVIDELPEASCSADENSPVGNYDIVVSGRNDDNYEFTYINGTLVIENSNKVDFSDIVNISIYPNPTAGHFTLCITCCHFKR